MVVLVYMIAGMSSRFNGIKQLCKVGPNDETLIEMSVKQALVQPFSKLIFITNVKTEPLFKDLFSTQYQNTPVEYVQQTYDTTNRERPWGTTDAVCSIIGKIDEPFILVNSDDIYGVNTFKEGYIRLSKGIGINYIGTSIVKNTILGNTLVNRGIVEVDMKTNKVLSLKETLGINPTLECELLEKTCNVNFICLQPNVLILLKKVNLGS